MLILSANTDSGLWHLQEAQGEASYVNTGELDEFDVCRVCHTGGQLLWCDACPHCFHLTCLQPPLDTTPPGDWFCSDCVRQSVLARKVLA